MDANGWLPTGDIATISDKGYLHITDCTKDVIKSGGEWISPSVIERVILTHDKVSRHSLALTGSQVSAKQEIVHAIDDAKQMVVIGAADD